MADQLRQIELSLELLVQDGGSPPTEFRIFKKGTTETSKGIFAFTAASADSCLAAAKRYGNEHPIDYGHAMHSFFAVDPAEAGKAAGWFKPEVRDGELWASSVSWTAPAEEKLRAREYRYFSPVFNCRQDGEVVDLVSVGLTNIPATYGQTPLMASQLALNAERLQQLSQSTQEAPTMKILLAKLGLAENATEAEALVKLEQALGTIAQLTQLTGKSGAEMLGTVQAYKAGFDQVATLSQELTAIKAAQLTSERDALISAGVKEGKVPPAYESVLKKLELSQVKEFLAVAVPVPAVAGGGKVTEPNGGGTALLTQEDRLVAAQMKISEKDMAAAREKYLRPNG